jgi:transposase
VAHLQHYGSEFHQGNIFGLAGLQTSYAEPLVRALLTYPTESVVTRAGRGFVFFVLRTGCQWNALQDTGLCSSSSAHRRFQEGAAAGVFLALWPHGLAEDDALQGIAWQWLAMGGARTQAPAGGETVGQNPTDRFALLAGQDTAFPRLGCSP